MGRQSSRLYYNGKDHKDIYYNGKYHNAMYFKDQGGIIWQKLMDSSEMGGCLINRKYGSTNIGINYLNIGNRNLSATVVADEAKGQYFNQIVSGKNRAFGFANGYYNSNFVWVSSDGKYWKKLQINHLAQWIYPCYDGFLYYSTDGNVVKVFLDKEDNVTEEKVIYENFALPFSDTSSNSFNQYSSHSGIWTKNGNKIQFLTHTGILREYDLNGIAQNLSADFTFYSDSKNYIYLSGSVYNETWDEYFSGFVILSCDETEIKIERAVASASDWAYGARYVIEHDNYFYFYFVLGYTTTIIRTSDFENNTTIEEWTENDYIDLDIIGGGTSADSSNVSSAGINKIRLYPTVEYQATLSENYTKDGDIAKVRKYDFRTRDYASFAGGMLNNYGAFYEVGGKWALMSRIAIWLDSPIITKETKGFAYFTDNIGVGVSYP